MNWRSLLVLPVTLGAFTNADACSRYAQLISDVPFDVPDREAVRALGTVTGYGRITRAIGQRSNVSDGVTLLVRIEEVVSGPIGIETTEIAVLAYGADCSSVSPRAEHLAQRYPVGSRVVIFGEAVLGFETPGVAVIVEENRDALASVIPPDARRTATAQIEPGTPRSNPFIKYEYERALIELADAPLEERFERLARLADFFAGFFASSLPDYHRGIFERLVNHSGVRGDQARLLLERFDRETASRQR